MGQKYIGQTFNFNNTAFTEANRKPMQIRKNGRDAAKQDFSVTRPELVYFEHVVGEPCLKKRRQQEESYSSPVTILLLLQLLSCKPQLWGGIECDAAFFGLLSSNPGFCYFWCDTKSMWLLNQFPGAQAISLLVQMCWFRTMHTITNSMLSGMVDIWPIWRSMGVEKTQT
jgi:hypothetical protein